MACADGDRNDFRFKCLGFNCSEFKVFTLSAVEVFRNKSKCGNQSTAVDQ
jgi:hypothetical protein